MILSGVGDAELSAQFGSERYVFLHRGFAGAEAGSVGEGDRTVISPMGGAIRHDSAAAQDASIGEAAANECRLFRMSEELDQGCNQSRLS